MYKETHTHEEHLSIVAQGLTKRFGSFTAVENLSFLYIKADVVDGRKTAETFGESLRYN